MSNNFKTVTDTRNRADTDLKKIVDVYFSSLSSIAFMNYSIALLCDM